MGFCSFVYIVGWWGVVYTSLVGEDDLAEEMGVGCGLAGPRRFRASKGMRSCFVNINMYYLCPLITHYHFFPTASDQGDGVPDGGAVR